MNLRRLWITVMLITSIFTPRLRADTFDCVRFLENYLNEIDSEPRLIPLQSGELPSTVVTERLLSDASAVRIYLENNPTSPWFAELKAFAANPRANTVIYLSEIGPTVWKMSELNLWIQMVNQGAVARADRARAILHHIGYDKISVPLISERAQGYVRAANIVSQMRALDRVEAITRGTIAEKDALNAIGMRNLLHIPHRQHRLTRFVFGPKGDDPAPRARDRGREVAHLGIDFEVNRPTARPLEPALMVQSAAGALWAVRVLVREPLMRRKLTLEHGELKTLGERLSPDQLLWLGIFPELAPHWRLARLVKAKLKYVNLSRPMNNFYSRLLSVPINESGDSLNLNLHRGEWNENSVDEPLGASLTLDGSGTPGGARRVRAWASGDWIRLDAFGDVVRQARLTLKKSQLRIDNLTPVQALALFAHLQNIYGEPWQ